MTHACEGSTPVARRPGCAIVPRAWLARFLWMTTLILSCSLPARAQDGDMEESGPATAAQPQTLDLRPQPVNGRVTRYQVWSQRHQTITMRSGPRAETASTQLQVNGQVTWTIDRAKSDGGSTCTMTMDWLTADLTLPDGTVQHNDSRQGRGETETVHRLLRAMAGVPIRVEVAADGSVQSVSGVDAVKRRVGEDLKSPDTLDFMESASDLATLPKAPASATPGRSSWDTNFTWNHDAGKLQQSIRHSLRGVEEIEGIPIAIIEGSGKLRLFPDLSQLPANSPKIDVRMTAGQINTQVLYDLQRHEAVGRHSNETRRIEMTVRLPQGTITRTLDEHLQSQALRIAEE